MPNYAQVFEVASTISKDIEENPAAQKLAAEAIDGLANSTVAKSIQPMAKVNAARTIWNNLLEGIDKRAEAMSERKLGKQLAQGNLTAERIVRELTAGVGHNRTSEITGFKPVKVLASEHISGSRIVSLHTALGEDYRKMVNALQGLELGVVRSNDLNYAIDHPEKKLSLPDITEDLLVAPQTFDDIVAALAKTDRAVTETFARMRSPEPSKIAAEQSVSHRVLSLFDRPSNSGQLLSQTAHRVGG